MGLLLLDSPDPAPAPARPAEVYASMLRALMPRGKLWQLIGGAFGSLLDKLLLGSADELARLDQRVQDLLREADPRTALELLPDYERELDVAGAIDLEERRGRIVARTVARQRFRPVDFQASLAPLLAQDPADVVVLERSPAFCAAIGDVREIYRFFVFRDPSLPGTAFIASAQAQLDKMKPSHTIGHVIESTCMLYGDPHSLYGRDLLGAVTSFVSASAPVTSRSTSLTVNAPSGTASGDTVLCFVWSQGITHADVNTGALPSGWSVLSRIVTGSAAATLLVRTATGSEPASHTFPCTADGAFLVVGQCLAYRAMDAAPLVDSAAATASTSPFATASLNVHTVSDVYLGILIAADNTTTLTGPGGAIVERVNQAATQDGFAKVEMFDWHPNAVGPTGTKTVTSSVSPVNAIVAAYVLRAQVVF